MTVRDGAAAVFLLAICALFFALIFFRLDIVGLGQ